MGPPLRMTSGIYASGDDIGFWAIPGAALRGGGREKRAIHAEFPLNPNAGPLETLDVFHAFPHPGTALIQGYLAPKNPPPPLGPPYGPGREPTAGS